MIKTLKNWFLNLPLVVRISKFVNQVAIPGFERIPILVIIRFFAKGIVEGYITSRASAISFSFFLALFPSIIFLFSLIPFIPIDGFQEALISQLELFIPATIYELVETTITDLVQHKRTSLLSFGFLTTLYLAANGINSMLSAFNLSYNSLVQRNWISQQLTSLWITLVLFVFVITAVVLILFGQSFIDLLVGRIELLSGLEVVLIQTARWLTILSLLYLSISLIYYQAPGDKTNWKFFSAGSSLATACTLLFSALFAYYLNHFNQYNKLYGSIGTLMAFLFWMYLNFIGLLIGFELNAAILGARKKLRSIADIDFRTEEKVSNRETSDTTEQ